MRWLKHGVVWKPSGSRWWARTHATAPTPIRLREDTLRVYVQCRDEHGVGRVGYVDLDPSDPRRVIRESEATVLDIGRRAGRFAFDRVYGGWWGRVVVQDGGAAVRRSAERYVARLRGHRPA